VSVTDCVMSYKARAAAWQGGLSDAFNWEIGSAVLRRDALGFDWLKDGIVIESTELKSLDGVHFAGTSTTPPNATWEYRGRVEGVLYSNSIGHVLVGEWVYGDGSVEAYLVQFFEGKPEPPPAEVAKKPGKALTRKKRK
jgi:hypothetical protein